ncbi:Rhodanese-like domain-containing protein [Mycotypha africana]|uniref:Rhodanese-like domain-containing protein n=1 Tax=Mycotypha africana TaxID=64632 RepID=UPI00230124A2|nr:Rhodanese-like domain-containing protein [Mycotypha africana]KAI8984433.1 Rhodanese-like domain-containing protein [Mycotypha africana]
MPLSRQRRNIIQNFLKEKQTHTKEWLCCGQNFHDIETIGKHVHQYHEKEIVERELQAQQKLEEAAQLTADNQANLQKLKSRRGNKGSSDPIAVTCNCDANASKVILFYKYAPVEDPIQFALDHEKYCANMTGKVRIAAEGINATLAGTNEDIDRYLDWLTHTPIFQRDPTLDDLKSSVPLSLLDPHTPRYKFFKPSAGCVHVFSELSVKVVDEICPLGASSVVLSKLNTTDHKHGKLSPEDFHKILAHRHEEDYILLDTRNYYESKIGHFEGAIQPPIRKFSQFPEFVERNKEAMKNKTILTYCTGGIRCEKATAFLREALPNEEIFMLDGGIHNYLEWWKQKDKNAHPLNEKEGEAIWQGKNYVFDARQSLGVDSIDNIVSQCQFCHTPWDTYAKCASVGCHLLVLCCDECKKTKPEQKVYCCSQCQSAKASKDLCACEKERKENEMKRLESLKGPF